VATAVRYLGHGGKDTVVLDNPSQFERITAVVVNADTRIKGRSRDGRDWNYVFDDAKLKATLSG
jgi:hypothetical protein